MNGRGMFSLTALVLGAMLTAGTPASAGPQAPREELLTTASEIGVMGGRLVVSLLAEPKTLNPVLAVDQVSRDVIRCLHADLIHINRLSQRTGSREILEGFSGWAPVHFAAPQRAALFRRPRARRRRRGVHLSGVSR